MNFQHTINSNTQSTKSDTRPYSSASVRALGVVGDSEQVLLSFGFTPGTDSPYEMPGTGSGRADACDCVWLGIKHTKYGTDLKLISGLSALDVSLTANSAPIHCEPFQKFEEFMFSHRLISIRYLRLSILEGFGCSTSEAPFRSKQAD